jgi:hypothetical protein
MLVQERQIVGWVLIKILGFKKLGGLWRDAQVMAFEPLAGHIPGL